MLTAQDTAVPLGTFTDIFATGAIRAWADWGALNEGSAHVRLLSTTTEQLADCHTAWYRTADGARAEWRDQHARHTTVLEESRLAQPDAEKTWPQAPQILPALDTGSGNLILLDGNHRAVALMRAPHPLPVLLMVLQGPMDPLIFPDLLHGCMSSATAEQWSQMVDRIDAKFLYD